MCDVHPNVKAQLPKRKTSIAAFKTTGLSDVLRKFLAQKQARVQRPPQNPQALALVEESSQTGKESRDRRKTKGLARKGSSKLQAFLDDEKQGAEGVEEEAQESRKEGRLEKFLSEQEEEVAEWAEETEGTVEASGLKLKLFIEREKDQDSAAQEHLGHLDETPLTGVNYEQVDDNAALEESVFASVKQPGLQGWLIDRVGSGYAATPIEWDLGDFYEEDCYLLSSTKKRRDGVTRTYVHLWQGSKATPVLKDAALDHLIQLFQLIKGKAVLYREREFYESQLLQSYFRESGMRHLRQSWYKEKLHNDPTSENFRHFFTVKHSRRCSHAYEGGRPKDIREDLAYILDLGLDLYAFSGQRANQHCKYGVATMLARVRNQRGGQTKTSVVDEEQFVQVLQDLDDKEKQNAWKRAYYRARMQVPKEKEAEDRCYEDGLPNEILRDLSNVKVFEVLQNELEPVRFREISVGQGFLPNSEKIYLVETNIEVLIWLGLDSRRELVEDPFSLADDYCHAFGNYLINSSGKTAIMLQEAFDDKLLASILSL